MFSVMSMLLLVLSILLLFVLSLIISFEKVLDESELCLLVGLASVLIFDCGSAMIGTDNGSVCVVLRLVWSVRALDAKLLGQSIVWSGTVLCAKQLSCIGRCSRSCECVSKWFCVVKLMLPNGFSYIDDDDEDVS